MMSYSDGVLMRIYTAQRLPLGSRSLCALCAVCAGIICWGVAYVLHACGGLCFRTVLLLFHVCSISVPFLLFYDKSD